MCTINGDDVSCHDTATPRGRTERRPGRSGEVEALVTSDGDVWTWERVIDEFGPAVHSYGRARGISDTDDLVQEVLTAVVQRARTFRGSSAELRSFVFTVAFRRVADRHRRAYRRQRLCHEPLALVEAADASVLDDDDAARALAALDRLDERSQSVLRLRYLDGCDVAEVAARMDLSATNVRAIQSRALKRLRERFEGPRARLRPGPLAVLAWWAPDLAGQRLRLAAGAWIRRAGGLRRLRERVPGGPFGLGQAGPGLAGGASLVAAVVLTAASVLGPAGSTATERNTSLGPLTAPDASLVAPATSPAPAVPASIGPAPAAPEPQVGPPPTAPAGAGWPGPVADAADVPPSDPAAAGSSADERGREDPPVAREPATPGPGSLVDLLPAPGVLAVPIAAIDGLAPELLAGPTDGLTTEVAGLVPGTVGAAIASTIDVIGGDDPPADSTLPAAPEPAPVTPGDAPAEIAAPVAGGQLSVVEVATTALLVPANALETGPGARLGE